MNCGIARAGSSALLPAPQFSPTVKWGNEVLNVSEGLRAGETGRSWTRVHVASGPIPWEGARAGMAQQNHTPRQGPGFWVPVLLSHWDVKPPRWLKTFLWRRKPLAANTLTAAGGWVPNPAAGPRLAGEYLQSTPDGTVAPPSTHGGDSVSLPRWLLLPQHSHGRGSPGWLSLRPGTIPRSRRRAAASHTGTTNGH